MAVLIILAASVVFLALGGFLYAPVIGRVLGERADRPTPAMLVNDGRDYVPTRTPVVFAHHFASIAGAGPIIGPVIALLYGWGPALAWILLGGVFLGAVHDYTATHIAVREGGKNLTVVARRYIGRGAFVLLLLMLVALLALVCAAFLDLSATALTSTVPLSTLKMESGTSIFCEIEKLNTLTGKVEPHAIIGGIASTSVVVITAFAPLIGFLYLKRKWPVRVCSLMAIALCIISILIGIRLPMAVQPQTWKAMLSVYVLLAAGLPVWLFLQSRDFINVHLLYVGIVFLVVSLVAAAIRSGGELAGAAAIPMNNWSEGSAQLGAGWPVMFITIACGAVSGFHSLCAGGTTCKQLDNEPAARYVGYFGMLLESLLAVCVVCVMIVGLSLPAYRGFCFKENNAVLAFAMGVGQTAHLGLGCSVAVGALGAMLLLEGFLVTTLDTAIRLTRYMIEEGWATFFGRYDVFAKTEADFADRVQTPGELAGTGGLTAGMIPVVEQPRTPAPIQTSGPRRWFLLALRYYWVNSGIAVALMLVLGWGNGYKSVWQIFGASNQLLAALALLVATCWLIRLRRPIRYIILPMLFMLATSITMLVKLLVVDYWPNLSTKLALAIADIVILAATAGVLALVLQRWFVGRTAEAGQAHATR
ncbi:MAG TPA: carbon starvation CstA family protein [Phycisphaerae bacterium]|nr:carbon starvation CstA family protein [Phycisphaerae bacterium]